MSKWETLKSKSNWHFDPTRKPTPGKDSYQLVHNFDIDFTVDIEECKTRVKPSKILDISHFPNASLESPPEEYLNEKHDVDAAGVDGEKITYEKSVVADIENFQKINQFLGLEDSTIRFHNQRPGQCVLEHIDMFSSKISEIKPGRDFLKDPSCIRRFIIFLDAWHLGQVLMFGNATLTQWKRGDCITWDWQDIPHATANLGWNDRPILQITGYVTDQTRKILKYGYNN